MIYLEEKTSALSSLIENQFPQYVRENSQKFLSFLTSYYESLETKFQPLDIVTNLIDYYSIGHYRPNQLIASTKLKESELLVGETEVEVDSTDGFPEKNGYIRINGEIIFYRSKTETLFKDCVRGTTALILDNIPKSNVTLTTSVEKQHAVNSVVENIAYTYSSEFFSRIKKEIAPLIPETLADDLDIAAFLSKIKSFYSAKGSLNGHRILFKILFNDRKFDVALKPRGDGAKIKVNNYGGAIPDPALFGGVKPQIVSGGSGYDNRKDNQGNLIAPPVVDIRGTGTGAIKNGLRPNDTAIILVTDIDQNGSITDIEVDDTGSGYVGSIEAIVRPAFFEQDQIVYSVSGRGTGRVDYFDPNTNELVLYDVIGYFAPQDELYTNQGEKARAFIAQSYISPILSRNGVIVKSEQQNIEFPREYTFKTSDAVKLNKSVIRLQLLDGYILENNQFPNDVVFYQQKDKKFGVNGVTVEADNYVAISDDTYEFEVTSNSDLNDIYLQPTTKITKPITGITSTTHTTGELVITVDDASRFPITNGIIFIDGAEIEYKTRSFNQFFKCTYTGSTTINLGVGDEVLSFGRKILRSELDENGVELFEWTPGVKVSRGQYKYYGDNLYVAKSDGVSGTTAPVHTSGSVSDGTYAGGDQDEIIWEYYSTNRFDHTMYIELNNSLRINPRFKIVAVPGDVVIDKDGSLHSKSVFEFSRFDSPNIKVYNFTTNEISDRLSSVLGTNYNRDKDAVEELSTDNANQVANIKNLPSYQSLTGFSTQHDFDEYIYVSGTGIPPWWRDIVNLDQPTLSAEESKKIGFTNQKLLTRWKKTGLISETQAFGTQSPTQKSIGLNLDGVQVNSYKGNVVGYGKINQIVLANTGDYPIPYDSSGAVFETSSYPKVRVQDPSNLDETILLANVGLTLSGRIVGVDFTTILSDWTNASLLSGFEQRPEIRVVNNNPVYEVIIQSSTQAEFNSKINTVSEEITITSHQFKTTDVVVIDYIGSSDLQFENIQSNEALVVRKISDDVICLYKTKSDCLLDRNRVSLTPFDVTEVHFALIGEQRNPQDFVPAELSLSFANGKIDNVVILNSGRGYIETPSIEIISDEKPPILLPFAINGKRVIDMRGELISSTSYDTDNSTVIDYTSSLEWEKTPLITIDNGSGAEATAYVANGEIVSIVLLQRGENYALPPKVSVVSDDGGKDAVIEAVLNSSGQIDTFNIINKGSGYRNSPRILIEADGTGGTATVRLNEWTFNLAKFLNSVSRIDSYGGYVYHEDDKLPTTNNPKKFEVIDYDLNFPEDLDRKQYRLFTTSKKLLLQYTRVKDTALIDYIQRQAIIGGRDIFTNPLSPQEVLAALLALTDAEVLEHSGHSPAIAVSYDGIPIYGGLHIAVQRNVPVITNPRDSVNPLLTSQQFKDQFEEAESRFRLKRIVTTDTSNPLAVQAVDPSDGVTKYFIPVRDGGPSLTEYPIGTFIEDYEYVQGGLNDLDQHNGRFSITPEFPDGRYCYFNTYKSFDDYTNQVIGVSSIESGFPYCIGPKFASTPADSYMNNLCRTSDKIPAVFTRIFEKDVDPIISDGSPLFAPAPAGAVIFPGIPHNTEYPSEITNLQRTVAEVESVSTGTVDSLIIEASGDDYRVGDKLVVDNSLTQGSGFGGFVSKVLGKKITFTSRANDAKTVTFTTEFDHGLTIGDYVYFDYVAPSTRPIIILHDHKTNPSDLYSQPISDNLRELLAPEISAEIGIQGVDTYKGKKIFAIDVNSKYTYALKYTLGASFIVSYDIDKENEYFILNKGNTPPDPPSGDTIILNCQNIPNRLYLHIGDYIYQINKSKNFAGPRRVTNIDSGLKTFTVEYETSTTSFETENLFYSAKSLGASGPIADISISQKGFNYKRLPSISGIVKRGTTDVLAGNGEAIIQTNSDTIGRINRVKYDSLGGGLDSNINVNYYLNIPSTAKVINNFEIYDVEIEEGGQLYDIITNIVAKEDGVVKDVDIKATVNLGRVVDIEIIDGGSNFSKVPTLEIISPQGFGAVLKAKIRRKKLFTDSLISANINSELYPIVVTGDVVNFDENTSTIEFNQKTGEFKNDELIFTNDGKPYGKLVSIRNTTAYAKAKPYAVMSSPRSDVTGNPSEALQKITDSKFYQDWSYVISSSRDTKEWKYEQDINTHPAGFVQFGKKLLERRKLFFENPNEIFGSSVIFTTQINDIIDLKLKETPCFEQVIAIKDPSGFSVGDYVFGSISGAIGKIIKIHEYTLTVELLTDIKFQTGELIYKVPVQFVFGIDSATDRSFVFLNGIMQEPEYSYETAYRYVDQNNNALNPPEVGDVVPKFPLLASDELLHYKTPSNLTILDSVELNEFSNIYFPSVDGSSYNLGSDFLENTIISIAGVVQNPASMSVNITEKYIQFNEFSGHNSKLFAVTSSNINRLEFTGSGTTFDLPTVAHGADACDLLLFYVGVNQSHLITDFTLANNQVTFSESVDSSQIFGWYMANMECEQVSTVGLLANTITGTWPCKTSQFMQSIHSSDAKNQTSLYEIRKETLDGTIFQDSDNQTLYGFNTKFTYTTPEYSKSFVEVLDVLPFDGTTKSFRMTSINGNDYKPDSGKNSLMVYVDNQVLDISKYTISGNTIYFTDAYQSDQECTIIDFNSNYIANDAGNGARDLDRLEVQHNGVRRRFNLSDNGVPQYTKNVGDVFAIRSGVFQRPDERHQVLDQNKIIFNQAPEFDHTTDLVWFNRQLLPLPTKNVVLDDFYCFDGERDHFPITDDGILFYPINVYHLFVVRNGVYQKPGIDFRLGTPSDVITPPGGLEPYTLDGSHLVFSEAPKHGDQITIFYSYDGLNQNIVIDPYRVFDGVTTTFPLTRNLLSTAPFSADHIQVYRNGVYQFSGSDYTIETTNGGPRIIFTEAPLENDDVFITEFDSLTFVPHTADFSQITPTIIGNTGATISQADTILIYKDGLLLTDGWDMDYITQWITFDEPALLSGNLRIFVVAGSRGELDEIYKFNGVQSSFPLTRNNQSKQPINENHIQVYRNGVYQYSNSDYTISTIGGPRITFTTPPLASDNIFVTNFDSTTTFEDATTLFTRIDGFTYQYTGFNNFNYLLIFINGVYQIDYTITGNVVNFATAVDPSDQIAFYWIDLMTQVDSYSVLDGVTTTFPLTKFNNSITVNTAADLQVYRNGVYQYDTGDYTTFTSFNGNAYITFATPPQETDEIFITNARSSSFDITGDFVQVNSTTLGNIGTLNANDSLLVYVQGVLQNNSAYTYDYVNQQLVFNSNVTLNHQLKILSIPTGLGVIDFPYEVDGVNQTFPLTISDVSISPSDSEIQVHRNGVYQHPTVDYTVSGSLITFNTAPVASDDIFITSIQSGNVEDLSLSQTNATTLSYTGVSNITSGIVLVYVNGIIQKDYTQNGNDFVFAVSVTIGVDKVTILHLPVSFANDGPKLFDGTTSVYPLTKNNTSIVSPNVFVYRNGVHQSQSDYSVGASEISLVTPPVSTDHIFTQNFTTAPTDLTSSFTALNQTEYQYSGTLDVRYPLVIFHGGIMQVRDSWTFDQSTQRLVFSQPITFPLEIYQLQECVVVVNQITTNSGITRYPLKNGRKKYSPSDAESLFVCIDGIVQEPGVSYNIEGSDIVFTDPTIAAGVPLFVVDASLLGLQKLDHLETAWEIGDRKYIRLLENNQSYTSSTFYVVKDNVVQTPAAYSIDNGVFSILDDPETGWDNIQIYNTQPSFMEYVDALGSIRSETSTYTDILMTAGGVVFTPTNLDILVSVHGVVQEPGVGYEMISPNVVRIYSTNILSDYEIVDVLALQMEVVDGLNDLLEITTDSQGLIHTKFRVRTTIPGVQTLLDSEDAFVVYGSVVQKPGTDYIISNETIEFVTYAPLNFQELSVWDASQSDYQVMDNLESFISYDESVGYTWRVTKNYQTLPAIASENLMVQIDGVVQKPSDYTITSSTFTINDPNYENTVIYDFTDSEFRLLDHPAEDFTSLDHRLLSNYQSVVATSDVDLFLLRDQVLQNPTEDYTVSNGIVSFTTLITRETDIFALYTHNSVEIIPIVEIPFNVCTGVQDTYTLPTTFTEDEKNRMILYLNGVPNFYGVDFNINGTTLSFNGGAFVDPGTIPFLILYTNLTILDDPENCPDGSETKFKLLYKGQNILANSSADILTSRNGVIQNPDVDYTVTIIGGYAGYATFVTPLPEEHNTFFVRMYDNRKASLTQTSPTTHIVNNISSVVDTDNIYVFANGNWMLPTKDYTISGNTITLQIPSVDVFAIEFTGIVKVLDEVHTPYDGVRQKFNLFHIEENFVPAPTVEEDINADESSILIIKNGDVLEPRVDYILTGDIRSQVQFTVAPIASDVIYVKAVGSMIKLDTINTGFDGIEDTFIMGTTSSFNFNVLMRDGTIRSVHPTEVDTRTGTVTISNPQSSSKIYYPNAEIERPREHEHQILVIKDGEIQSPVYDYYIDNHKLVFNQPPSAMTDKVVIMDFRGCKSDVAVDNRMYQVKVGDTVHLDCSIDQERTFVIDREVTEIISPTIVKTTTTSNNVYTGFAATAAYSDGKVTDITVTNGGTGYDYPPVLTTLGSGVSASGAPNVNPYPGGEILSSTAISSRPTYSGTTTLLTAEYNSLPVRGYLYVPNTTETNLNVVVLYHGTITSPITPLQAASNFLQMTLENSRLNLGNNIILSVAYPQDAIPGWTQAAAESVFPGIVVDNLFFGDNIAYAEAALLWSKNLLKDAPALSGKTINKLYTFGHSQGGSIVHKLNTRISVDGVIANAPGPIDLATRCLYHEVNNEVNPTCKKLYDVYGSVQVDSTEYDEVSVKSFLTEPVSPVLYTQCFDDTASDFYGVPQTQLMQNVIQNNLSVYNDVTFKYYEIGGHDGFNYNAEMQRDIREFIEFGKLDRNKITIKQPGWNVHVDQKVIPTVYAFVERKQQLTVSNLTRATALTSNISDTTETIPVIGTTMFDANPPVITVTADTGAGAEFIPYVINGYLRKVEIVNGGSGYDERSLTVEVIGGGGSGAVLEPFLDASGTIIDLKIRDHGVGYDSYRAYINSEVIEYTAKTPTQLIGVTRNVMNYELSPWEFPLVKNETFITPHSVDHLRVFRNGVHQTPDIDFELQPINNTCYKIFFKTPIENTDDVFITHFDSANGFSNITSDFTQSSPTVLQHTGSLTYDDLLIFVDGVIQLNNSWTFDSNNDTLTFGGSVDLSSQRVLIYKITTGSGSSALTPFTMTAGTNTYTLSSSVTSEESIMVVVDGVVQEPGRSYTVSGTDITFTNINDGSVVYVSDFAAVGYRILDDINVSRWINTSTCAIGHKQDDRVYSGTYL